VSESRLDGTTTKRGRVATNDRPHGPGDRASMSNQDDSGARGRKQAAQPEHKLYMARSEMNPSVGVFRWRAFCRCGWVGRPTESEDCARAQYGPPHNELAGLAIAL
jgi:hypothetical protein